MTPAGEGRVVPAGALCPCGSTLRYAACCGPLVAGERLASTAEQLMRSRYTAYAVGEVLHVWRTWHPATRPEQVTTDPATTWTGLTVLRVEGGGENDETGVVEFVARWRELSAGRRARAGELHEVSRFGRRAGRWLYVGGDVS
ncbi:MAG TPA: YchJ family metal-binding protein [Humibacillus xanthopallidus]|nr:YchJ family metal-binding protein [Humibacillus xanthopallidus]